MIGASVQQKIAHEYVRCARKRGAAGVAAYARVSSYDQRSDLDGQVARVVEFVTRKGCQENRLVKLAATKQEPSSRKLASVAAGNKRL